MSGRISPYLAITTAAVRLTIPKIKTTTKHPPDLGNPFRPVPLGTLPNAPESIVINYDREKGLGDALFHHCKICKQNQFIWKEVVQLISPALPLPGAYSLFSPSLAQWLAQSDAVRYPIISSQKTV